MCTLMISGSRVPYLYSFFSHCPMWASLAFGRVLKPCFLYKHEREFSTACTFSSFQCAALVLDNFVY
uniref:Uncharacterized protein n=1 Tax=Arundo donax TaxID=35708 RepID=A0A0A9GD10_ARUDO